MQEELTALLLATPALQAIVGDRIHWGRAPQDTPTQAPYLVMNRSDGTPDYHLRGPSGYVITRLQVDTYAESYTAARNAADAHMAKLSGLRSGIFLGIFVDAMRDLPASDPGTVTNLFRVSVDYVIHHSA